MSGDEYIHVLADIAQSLGRIANALEALMNCTKEYKDGQWRFIVEVPDPIIAYQEA